MLYGYSPNEIYDIFKDYCKKIKYVEGKKILKAVIGLIFKRKLILDGLNSGEIINELISEKSEEKKIKNINEIKMSLVIPSVDLNTGEVYCFSSKEIRSVFSDKVKYVYQMPIGKAVQASCSYPGIFSPCKCKGKNLIDGGIRENVPWKEVEELGAEKVLSIVFENEINEKCCKNIIEIADQSIQLLSRELSNYELKGSDYILKIKSKDISLLDMHKIDELYQLGYETTKKNISNIKKGLGI